MQPAADNGYTALYTASVVGHLVIVQHLIASGADVHAVDNKGATSMMVASQEGHDQVVQCLLSADAKVDVLPTIEAAQQAQQPRRQRQAEGTATPPLKAMSAKLGHLRAGSAKTGGGGGEQQLQQHGAGASAGARQGLRQGRQPAPLTHQPPRMTSVVTPVPIRSGRGQGLAVGTKRSSSETHETTPPQSPPAFQAWA